MPLTEDPTRARRIATTKPTDGCPQFDGHALPWEVLEAPTVAAVPGLRHLTAQRTGWVLFNMNSQPESVGVSFDVVQYQNARIWQKGLRMACGRCHRSQRLKHFIYNAFYAGRIKIAEEPLFG